MQKKDNNWKNIVASTLHVAVLAVSIALIVVISIDAFAPEWPEHSVYTALQLPFCVIFLLDFFFEFYCSAARGRFLRHNFLVFFVSIPYSIILSHIGIAPVGIGGIVIHYLPTLRAVIAMAYVVSFVSRNRLIGLFASYVIILVLATYFSSIIFFLAERHINPSVTGYWQALYWSLLEVTTLGAPFYPFTTTGKAVSMVISAMGMLMFPLFTVYLTQMVQKYAAPNSKQSAQNS